jgi:FKBP-type peptidyl-prolyl cis-trans isomerase SlyD
MKVDKDMIVSVHYRGTLTENGEEFDSSHGGDPLTFMVGKGQMIPGFEEEIMGTEKGDKKSFDLEAERAYGQHDPTGIQKVPKDQFPEDIEVGSVLAAEMEDGQQVPLSVVEISDDGVTIDFNHMLAGKNLTFEVEIVELRDSTDEEKSHGHAHGPGGHQH